ncbi:GDSL esterase/lipase At1g71691 [Nymphaea colorata]|nr:GDSL esterase/lipase At1g71691 [Nymphaea colorata]
MISPMANGASFAFSFTFTFVFFFILVVVVWMPCAVVEGQPADGESRRPRQEMVPALFVFGDSLIDNGNNNNLPSLAKANYYPYGIDFRGGPTGRFSNGYTMVDEIAELLGLPLVPPFSEASGSDVLHGVNYASAAAGILDITGRNFMGRIPFNQQIENFQGTLDSITTQLGGVDRLSQSIGRSIFFVGMGSNDYLNNYLMPNYVTRNQYTGQQFASLLVDEYARQLTTLYNLGARKFVLAGVGILGCIPSILAQSLNSSCDLDVNKLVFPFNANARSMVDGLNANLPGARFVFLDVYSMFNHVLSNPTSYGFSVVDRGCCGVGRNAGQLTCLPFQTPCTERESYVFWDAFHPTERINVLLARMSFTGPASIAYPINIQQLAFL